jgi:hypothetical protein
VFQNVGMVARVKAVSVTKQFQISIASASVVE